MWNKQVEYGNPWTLPVTPELVAAARRGEWSIGLTEQKPVPRDWFPADLRGIAVLCLACGGGQQGPILAAAGATVTVLDNSPRQLERDRQVAEREGLEITTVEGDMRDLSMFPDGRFDLVFNPVSNPFIPDVLPVWRESFRVLRKGGVLMAGFMNPDIYIFAYPETDQGVFIVQHPLPFDSLKLSEAERNRQFGTDSPLEFSHSLNEQIGGQLEAGFLLAGFYEDTQTSPIGKYFPAYIATRAVKP
jgi:SAM-dependent methyltransferase